MNRNGLLWWVIPGLLAGMRRPYIHPERRMNQAGALTDHYDELVVLHSHGVRAVVSLLNLPNDQLVYESAGFDFLSLPIPDGGAPTFDQVSEFTDFVSKQHAATRPVAIHCQAGIGRTGTLLASYLIYQGESAEAAIGRVRAVERVAIETQEQIQFLVQYAERLKARKAGDSW